MHVHANSGQQIFVLQSWLCVHRTAVLWTGLLLTVVYARDILSISFSPKAEHCFVTAKLLCSGLTMITVVDCWGSICSVQSMDQDTMVIGVHHYSHFFTLQTSMAVNVDNASRGNGG